MRLRSVAIFGIGYLVGTRAGRDRYEQLAGSVRSAADSDLVRGYVDRAFGLARRSLASLNEEADEAVVEAEDATEDIGEDDEVQGSQRGSGNRARRRRAG